jgi:peptidoglycan LD-endopeptidase CwlK
MNTRIEDLLPEVQEMAYKAIAIMKAQDIKHVVTSTFRSKEVQQALYAQGRNSLNIVNQLRENANLSLLPENENTYTVTNCNGVTNLSPHQSRKAIDIVPANRNGDPCWPDLLDSRWGPIALIMKACGFTWGGDWKSFPDYPHYQID